MVVATFGIPTASALAPSRLLKDNFPLVRGRSLEHSPHCQNLRRNISRSEASTSSTSSASKSRTALPYSCSAKTPENRRPGIGLCKNGRIQLRFQQGRQEAGQLEPAWDEASQRAASCRRRSFLSTLSPHFRLLGNFCQVNLCPSSEVPYLGCLVVTDYTILVYRGSVFLNFGRTGVGGTVHSQLGGLKLARGLRLGGDAANATGSANKITAERATLLLKVRIMAHFFLTYLREAQ